MNEKFNKYISELNITTDRKPKNKLERGFQMAVKLINAKYNLYKPAFKNGDLVQYSHGLKYHFIGMNPINKNEAYCSRVGKPVRLLPIDRLELV